MASIPWKTLRDRHPRLVYKEFKLQLIETGLEITYQFILEPGIKFSPRILIHDVTQTDLDLVGQAWLNEMVFSLGLVELMSYWKAACPAEIVVEAGWLSPEQISWWNTLLIEGLGEFFFVNQIDFTVPNFVHWKSTAQPSPLPALTPTPAEKPDSSALSPDQLQIMIPVGGGKDSVVSLEILKKFAALDQLATFHIYPTQAAKDTAAHSGITRQVLVDRWLDPKLFELNRAGYLNGHTPFSSLAAFISVLTAGLRGFDWIPLSNERSSNEGNVTYLGHNINHQYSKTFAFEQHFQDYIQTYLEPRWPQHRPHPRYFSLLRPLYELQIAQLFAQTPGYFPLFRSCNVGRSTNTWCGRCPKCLFAYSILAPFIKPEILTRAFGANLLDSLSLLPLAKELAGKLTQKPFECVGTHEETIIAWYLTAQHYRKSDQTLPLLLAELDRTILAHEPQLAERAQTLASSWNDAHFVPAELESVLKTALHEAQQESPA